MHFRRRGPKSPAARLPRPHGAGSRRPLHTAASGSIQQRVARRSLCSDDALLATTQPYGRLQHDES